MGVFIEQKGCRINQTQCTKTLQYVQKFTVVTESRILASRDFPAVSLLTLCRMNGVTSLPMMPCSLRNSKDNEINTSKIYRYILDGLACSRS